MPNDYIVTKPAYLGLYCPLNKYTKHFYIFTNKSYLGFISLIGEITHKMFSITFLRN